MPNSKNLKARIYVCVYTFLNCTLIFLLATLRGFGSRQLNANKSLPIREATDVAMCCWRGGGKQKGDTVVLGFIFLRHKQIVNKQEDHLK